MFHELGSFVITKGQRERYKAGDLWHEWLTKYPQLFDGKDQQFFQNQGVFGYGFVEALTMIFLLEGTGYYSIFGSYGLQTQPQKNSLVKSLVSEKAWEYLLYKGKPHPMPPDIFAYAPDKSDYFFCEVKGPGDRLRDTQISYFQKLEKLTGKMVYTVKYRFPPFNT
jgi:hypothetical protein